jgi:hypothetical protein
VPRTHIRYRSGYKYQLVEEYSVTTTVIPKQNIETDYIDLNTDGELIIKKGYAWDGPSGPTIDTKNFMRGSLIHDALYQLMRTEHLSKDEWRAEADLELKRFCLEDGMSKIRAWWVHRAVSAAGDPAASPESRKEVTVAP